jgi:hypothetical protein
MVQQFGIFDGIFVAYAEDLAKATHLPRSSGQDVFKDGPIPH